MAGLAKKALVFNSLLEFDFGDHLSSSGKPGFLKVPVGFGGGSGVDVRSMESSRTSSDLVNDKVDNFPKFDQSGCDSDDNSVVNGCNLDDSSPFFSPQFSLLISCYSMTCVCM